MHDDGGGFPLISLADGPHPLHLGLLAGEIRGQARAELLGAHRSSRPRVHEHSAPLERLSLMIHVLPLRQDLIIKALVLFFMPFLFYSILYICSPDRGGVSEIVRHLYASGGHQLGVGHRVRRNGNYETSDGGASSNLRLHSSAPRRECLGWSHCTGV